MNLFQISFLVVVVVPTLCNGLKCWSCNVTAEGDVPAPCKANQTRMIQKCSKSSSDNRFCGMIESVTKDGVKIETIALGCRIGVKTSQPTKCVIILNAVDSTLYRTCRCQTDLCNDNINSLKCYACKGKALGPQQHNNDYVCEKDEIPEVKVCALDEPVCTYKWTPNIQVRGCLKRPKKRVPCCRGRQLEKWCHCQHDLCNTKFNDSSIRRCSGNNQHPSSMLMSTLFLYYSMSIFFATNIIQKFLI